MTDNGRQHAVDSDTRLLDEVQRRIASMPAAPSPIRLTAIHLVGSPLPWRLIESTGKKRGHGAIQRQMLYFSSSAHVLAYLEEQRRWRIADARFVEKHMTCPSNLGVTEDLVPEHLFGLMFDETRSEMRSHICTTLPERAVVLQSTA